ncbi:MAG: 2Fe-2S iron-sulfur cluster binding domain-containing protein [Rhizobiales bacterium]|nr:2Fe-2S iron-sulfur cluster binding domain-containing protein [Hyphomicrobiales bacterium]
MIEITLVVNGDRRSLRVEARRLLADVLREEFDLAGVHIGCAQGSCGCCTVHVDGVPRLSCLTFAVQCDGKSVRTVEDIGGPAAEHALQQAFRRAHALQCGYCTPGFIMTLAPFVEAMATENRLPDENEIRDAMSGNICRCTGYQGIVEAVRQAIAERIGTGAPA